MPTPSLRKFIAAAVLLLAAQAAAAQEADAAPPAKEFADGYYPLVCKAGSAVRIKYHVRLDAPTTPLTVTFRKGDRPSGPKGENLEPGVCSWVDRGMGADEPDRLHASPLGIASIDYELDSNGQIISQRMSVQYLALKGTGVYFLYVKNSYGGLSVLTQTHGRGALTRIRGT